MSKALTMLLVAIAWTLTGCHTAKGSQHASAPTPSASMEPVPTPNYRPPTVAVPGVGPDHAVGYLFVGPQTKPYSSGHGAAGVCEPANGKIATIRLGVDTTLPRCAVVQDDQWLRVVNDFHEKLIVSLGNLRVVVGPSGTVTVDRPFASYLTPGSWLLVPNFPGSFYGGEVDFHVAP